jgi:uncharacterized low-complexity protein
MDIKKTLSVGALALAFSFSGLAAEASSSADLSQRGQAVEAGGDKKCGGGSCGAKKKKQAKKGKKKGGDKKCGASKCGKNACG